MTSLRRLGRLLPYYLNEREMPQQLLSDFNSALQETNDSDLLEFAVKRAFTREEHEELNRMLVRFSMLAKHYEIRALIGDLVNKTTNRISETLSTAPASSLIDRDFELLNRLGRLSINWVPLWIFHLIEAGQTAKANELQRSAERILPGVLGQEQASGATHLVSKDRIDEMAQREIRLRHEAKGDIERVLEIQLGIVRARPASVTAAYELNEVIDKIASRAKMDLLRHTRIAGGSGVFEPSICTARGPDIDRYTRIATLLKAEAVRPTILIWFDILRSTSSGAKGDGPAVSAMRDAIALMTISPHNSVHLFSSRLLLLLTEWSDAPALNEARVMLESQVGQSQTEMLNDPIFNHIEWSDLHETNRSA